MADKLNDDEITSRLLELDGWERVDESIERHLEFDAFMDAIEFINEIAEIAEDLDHHPEIFNVYNQVDLTLTTHDAGGLTAKDFELAARIDNVAREF